ncbi:MAG: aminotransferase class V-fold PLP-dependent enzyme [Candidatus Adiutrix sp.]|jgi:cysteine desulfurase family protein|nr:aminotransferase class V-fold PLP-dependent enzyme [Candidatus Adiutrix sp.]
MIYLDQAATSHPKPDSVTLAVVRAMKEFGNPSRGAHAFSLDALRCVEQTRARAAAFFGCPRPERVVFTKNVTEALNLAIASVDGHLVTTEAEHNSILRPVHLKKDFTIVPVDDKGRYSDRDIERALRPDSRAVVLAQASNLTGGLAPVEKIGRLCRERNLLFILDTAQSAGLIRIDQEALGVDALCFTGHKALYGPTGTGGLCLSERFTPRPLMVGGSGSRSFETGQPPELPDLLEAGTLNSHGLAGLAAGLEYVEAQGPEQLLKKARNLARRFYLGLGEIPGVTFYGDYESRPRLPIVTINLGLLDSGEVAAALSEDYGLAVRAGAHCAPLLHRRFGTVAQGALRFSFSHFNTEAEVDAALRALTEINQGLVKK